MRLYQLRLDLNRARRHYIHVLAALIAAEEAERRRRARRRRRWWVRPWIERRVMQGQYENLMAELERESEGDFKAFLRMEPAMFHELVQRLSPRLTKNIE